MSTTWTCPASCTPSCYARPTDMPRSRASTARTPARCRGCGVSSPLPILMRTALGSCRASPRWRQSRRSSCRRAGHWRWTGFVMSATRWRSSLPTPATRPVTLPSGSWWRTGRCRRWSTRWRRLAQRRRCCGTTRRAIYPTGSSAATRRRSRRRWPAPPTRLRSSWSTTGWSLPRSSRAPRSAITMPPPIASNCC
jgi:hypothetical protein